MAQGTRPRTGCQKAGCSRPPRTGWTDGCGERISAQQVAPQTRGPGPPGASTDAARGHAAPPPSAPVARSACLCTAWRPGRGSASGASSCRRSPPAAVGAMALPGARARGWAAAAKMAQRRRRAEGASPSRAPRSQRAALYVHVSGRGTRGSRGAAPGVQSLPAGFPRPQGKSGMGPSALTGKCFGPET